MVKTDLTGSRALTWIRRSSNPALVNIVNLQQPPSRWTKVTLLEATLAGSTSSRRARHRAPLGAGAPVQTLPKTRETSLQGRQRSATHTSRSSHQHSPSGQANSWRAYRPRIAGAPTIFRELESELMSTVHRAHGMGFCSGSAERMLPTCSRTEDSFESNDRSQSQTPSAAESRPATGSTTVAIVPPFADPSITPAHPRDRARATVRRSDTRTNDVRPHSHRSRVSERGTDKTPDLQRQGPQDRPSHNFGGVFTHPRTCRSASRVPRHPESRPPDSTAACCTGPT